MQVPSLGREDPLEEGVATHSSVLAWSIPWTEEPGGYRQTTGLQRVRQDLATETRTIPTLSGSRKTVYAKASYPDVGHGFTYSLRSTWVHAGMCPSPAEADESTWFYFITAWLFLTKKKQALFPFPPKYLIYLSLLVISVLEVYHGKWLAVPLI